MFEIKPTQLNGCFELHPKVFEDARGHFVKVFQNEAFVALCLETNFGEEYYSVSNKNVIRGMHFQLPPMDHVKVIREQVWLRLCAHPNWHGRKGGYYPPISAAQDGGVRGALKAEIEALKSEKTVTQGLTSPLVSIFH
jgi:hypothetical protein